MALILDGIRIIEIAQAAAAPMAGRLLADLGADVIRIENPSRLDIQRTFQARPGDTLKAGRGVPSNINYSWELYGMNKRSMTLNLGSAGAVPVLHKLIEKADVVVSNLRPYELKKFKLEYKKLNKLNPRLIFASLTGYGRKGPYKDSPGFDIICYWARTGIPLLIEAGRFMPAFGDNMGGLMLAYGILAALYERERTGLGQEVDMSLFGVGVFQVCGAVMAALIEKREYEGYRPRVRDYSLNPLVGTYLTKDERQFMLMCLEPDRYWPKVCRAIGREELINDPKFSSFEARAKNRMELFSILEETFKSKTLAEWKPLFIDIPSSPVQKLTEVANDEQARANDFFVTLDHPVHGPIEVVAPPVKFSRTPASVRKAAPEHGQHTEEVLLEYGYTWEDITQFKEQGLIA